MSIDRAAFTKWRKDRGAASPSLITGSMLAAFIIFSVAGPSTGVASAAISSPAPVPPGGSIGLRLVDVPKTEANDPRARIYIVDHVAPGSAIERRIEVSNSTSSDLHVVLYPAAAVIADGRFLGSAGHTPNDLSTWTSVRPAEADIPAGTDVLATVTIFVPEGTTSGERYGAVWAQVSSTPAAGGGVTQISRVGVRVYLSVGFGGPPASDFTINSMTAERSSAGQPIVLATVHNTGGAALDMSGRLQLSGGPGGISAGPFPATLGTTLGIGDTEPVTIPLDRQLPSGPWDARITLESGLLQRSAEAMISFPEVGASLPVITRPISPGWTYPVLIALSAILLLSMTLLFFVLRRPRLRSRKTVLLCQ